MKPVKYKFQIQIHDWKDTDTHEVFNSAKRWYSEWYDVGVITISEVLEHSVESKTCFTLANLPESLGVIDAVSPEDYNSTNYSRKFIYGSAQFGRTLKAVVAEKTKKYVIQRYQLTCYDRPAFYLISFKTGDRKGAGTDAKLSFEFIGEKGTIEFDLHESLDAFETGQVDSFVVRNEEVGLIRAIKIHLKNWGVGSGKPRLLTELMKNDRLVR